MEKMLICHDSYEKQAWAQGSLICGVDEVGRGCLAGPLLTASVILPQNCPMQFKDSKKLSAKQREAAYAWLKDNALSAVAHYDHNAIAHYNIYQATLRAMRQSLCMLASKAPQAFTRVSSILVDAMPVTLPISLNAAPITSIIRGEDASSSIAAASIIAKVTRDRLMQNMAPLFPRYGFESNKAYASEKHCAALISGPASFMHRNSFVATMRANKQGKLA